MFFESRLNPNLCSFTLILLMTFVSCKSDVAPEATVDGLWKLEKALRNDRLTNSLDGLYMDFHGTASFDSNLLGDTTSFSTEIIDNKITVDHNLIKQFKIQALNDTLLKLETEINDDKLLFVFKR